MPTSSEWNHRSSALQQLLVPAQYSRLGPNHTILPQRSGPFCLHAQSSEQQGCWQAEVKRCACWPAICKRRAGCKGSLPPVCHISPLHLIPATVSLNNNLLPEWKARCSPTPTRGGNLCLLQNKRLFETRGCCRSNRFHSMKPLRFYITLIWARVRYKLKRWMRTRASG